MSPVFDFNDRALRDGGLPQLRVEEAQTLVIFGGTGDLTRRKLLPALYALGADGLLPDEFQIVAFGRRDYSSESFREEMIDEVCEHSRLDPEREFVKTFAKKIHYFKGELDHGASYHELSSMLDDSRRFPKNRVFYLSTAPDFFRPVIGKLVEAQLVYSKGASCWSRVVIEKPFGRDLEPAFAKAVTGLDLVSRDLSDGVRGYGYKNPQPRVTLTAAAALCLQFAGQGGTPKTRATLRYLEDVSPDPAEWRKSGALGAIYGLYYVSQAKFHEANRGANTPLSNEFKSFYVRMVRGLREVQFDDGRWETMPKADNKNTVIDTASGALSLMVIYRHLSTNHEGAIASAVAEEARTVEEDVDDVGFD